MLAVLARPRDNLDNLSADDLGALFASALIVNY